MNKNSKIFNTLTKSMWDLSDTIGGSRYSAYSYTLQAETNNLNCNITIVPQTTVLVTRIFGAPKHHLEQTTFDYTFATDISGQDFDNLSFNLPKDKESIIAKYLVKLTDCVNTQDNWRFTPSYDHLLSLMEKNGYSDLIRQCNTINDKYHDMNKVINKIVQTIGINKAKNIIENSYDLTPLAHLWYESIKSLKINLDKNSMSHEDMSGYNYFQKDEKIKRDLQEAQTNK